jgi:hypothetical protein
MKNCGFDSDSDSNNNNNNNNTSNNLKQIIMDNSTINFGSKKQLLI